MSVILLAGAVLIDGTGATPRLADILVEVGRIAAIGADLPAPPGAERVALDGRFIAPGLIDSHVHLAVTPGSVYREDSPQLTAEIQRQQLRALLSAGVTTVLDCGASAEVQAQLSAEPVRPRILWLGEILGPAGGYPEAVIPGLQGVPGAEAIRDRIAQTAAADTAGLTVTVEAGLGPPTRWPLFSPEERDLIRTEAQAHGTPIYVHAMGPEEYPVALSLAPHAIVHGPESASHALAQQVAAADPYVISTLSIYSAPRRPYQPPPEDVALRAHPTSLQTLEDRRAGRLSRADMAHMMMPRVLWWGALPRRPIQIISAQRQRAALRALARLHAAGVRIVVGTDAPTWPLMFAQLPGSTTLLELELLEQAGLSPAEILQAATVRPAEMLGLDDVGALEVGHIADLVVLREDPLQHASAWRSVEQVMRAGELRAVAGWLTDP